MSLAPIAFFAYKRPEHTKRSLESLHQNLGAKDSELFIYCDGVKRPEDSESVELVRKIVKSQKWCGTVHIIEREQNIGLANSIISGVTEICDRYGKIIVIEDDLVLSPYFLKFMNASLDLYKNESRVMQVSGYIFPVNLDIVKTDTLFLPFTTSWGWATWKRAWDCFDPSSINNDYEIIKNNVKRKCQFNLNNSYPYFDILNAQINHKIDSWAIRWYLATFLLNGLTLYPKFSLVENIGFDGSGTHCGLSLNFSSDIYTKEVFANPLKIESEAKAMNLIFDHLRKSGKKLSLLHRIAQMISRSLKTKT